MLNDTSTWCLKVIIRDARRHPEIDDEFFAKQLMLATRPDSIGLILRTGYFADWVEGELVTPYDGCGCLVDENGKDGPAVEFDVDKLHANEKEYPFVRWYNK